MPRKNKWIKNESHCIRCGVPIAFETAYRTRPTNKRPAVPRLWCQPCGEKVAFGYTKYDLPDWWLGRRPKPIK